MGPRSNTPKEQNMSTKQTILQQLALGPQTSAALGTATNRPQATVHRNIATLRRDGYDIITRGSGVTAEYVLGTHVAFDGVTGKPLPVNQAQSAADDARDEYASAEYHEDEPWDDAPDFFDDGYDDDLEVDSSEDDDL